MIELLAGPLLLYLELSCLIGLGFVVFGSLERLAAWGVLRFGCAGMGRLGRTIFLATLLSPLAAHLLLSLPNALLAAPPAMEQLASPGAPGASPLDGPGWVAEPLAADPSSATRGSLLLARLTPAQARLAVTGTTALLLCGLAIASTAVARQVRRLRRLVRAAVPLRRYGRLHVVVSDRTRVPFSTAVCGGAHVVLPVALLRHPDDLRIVLRHELQHHRRADPQWAIGLELFRLLFFWHPAARLWVRRLLNLQELACDEALVRRGLPIREYGSCLLRVAARAVEGRMVTTTAMATGAERGARLRRRIDMLFDHDKQDSRRARRTAGVVGVLLVTALAQLAAWSWPTAADLPAREAGPPATVETLALANGVRVDSLVTDDEGLMTVVELSGPVENTERFLVSLAAESGIELRRLRVVKQVVPGEEGAVRATIAIAARQADLPSPVGGVHPGGRTTIDDALDLFRQGHVAELKLEFENDSATVFVKGTDGDCPGGLPHVPEADCTSPPPPVAPAATRPEAPDLEFENPDGTKVRLSHLQGKVVLVDFWASWCRPCVDELPYLKALDRELGGADFEIAGISLSRSRQAFEAFVEEHDLPWPQLHVDQGWRSAAAGAFELRAVPSHFLVDRSGHYIQVPLGNPEALTRAVEALIAER